jgi:lactate permease
LSVVLKTGVLLTALCGFMALGLLLIAMIGG